MKVLVVGTGAREHAIADALKDDVELYCYMSKVNPGISKIAEFAQGDEGEIEKVAKFAVDNNIDIAFIGPEAPLGKGIVDELEKNGISCVGPSQSAARIETDKSFMIKYFDHEGFVSYGDVTYIDLTCFQIEKEFVLRRSDGTSLYSTRDLAYHRYKATQGDVVLDILGSDHKLAAQQINVIFKEILREIPPEVIFYEFITLPSGSMSTRKGVFVSVDELVDEAVKRAADEIKSRNPDLTDEEIKPMAEDIGVGAIRFFIAKLSPEKHLTFKWDEALSFERGCASIQYAHARACKLLKKSGKDVSSLAVSDDWVPNENEKDLIRTIAKFPQVIEDCANKKRIHNITQYCQDLAGAFNKFYKAEQVIGSDVEDTRLVLVDRAKTTLKNALDILGVPAPQKM